MVAKISRDKCFGSNKSRDDVLEIELIWQITLDYLQIMKLFEPRVGAEDSSYQLLNKFRELGYS
jgi:hypothetical protein